MAIERQPVSSSNIASVGHEGDTLEIEFKNGGIYQYHGVPSDVFDKLVSSKSIGGFLHTSIKSKYKHSKI